MKLSSLSLLFLLFCSLFTETATALDAEGNSRIFTEASSFFHQAKAADNPEQARQLYEKALLRYEQLARDVHNGRLYYDIGNTYTALDDIGRAIANYRRAEKLMPGDENLAQNLSYVLSKRADKVPFRQKTKLLQTIFFWYYDLAQHTRFMLFCGLYLLFWGTAGIGFFSCTAIPRWVSGSLLALNLLLATSLALDHYMHSSLSGVIVSPEIVARRGHGYNYQPSFTTPLHAGTEFRLIEKRSDWLHVELNDGRQCWLPLESSELI